VATLENAISLAVQAHRGQKDKAGMAYIVHPLKVMCRMKTEKEMMVAVLHDVVEDTHYTLEDLRKAGYPDDVVAAVDALSRRDDESYEDFIERISLNPLAIRVKLGDLEDNMDIRRNLDLSEKDLERLNRYLRAWARLTATLDSSS
jgi:(p)ppGpp synthase/HD superfamily hydrolase